MYCRHCGIHNEASSTYCRNCGNEVRKRYLATMPLTPKFGTYEFREALPGEAEEYWNAEPTYVFANQAERMSVALGFHVPPSNRGYDMEPGDTVLVFQLVNPGVPSEHLVRGQDYRIGILKRT